MHILLWCVLLGWASTTHVASLSAVEAATFFLQMIPLLNTQHIQLCSIDLHVVFLSNPTSLGFIPVAFLIVVTSQDVPPSLPFSASWFAVRGATQAGFDFCPEGVLLSCSICPPIESGGLDWCFLQDGLMKAWCQPLFKEHEGPSVVFTPSCQCIEVLELGNVIIQCVLLHFDMHQLLVHILYLYSVSEGLLKCMGEGGPKPFIMGVDSLCKVLIDLIHYMFDPVIDHWSTNEADCKTNAVKGYKHGVVLTVGHAVDLEFPQEVITF